MAKIDDIDQYEAGKEARQNVTAYLTYVIVGIVLIAIEISATGGWAFILVPITIIAIFLIAKNRSVIRGFLGIKANYEDED